MRATLFREDALDFNRERLLGDALAARPLSLRFFAGAGAALAASIVAFAWWGEYTPKVHVSGYLAPRGGLIRISASQTGTLVDQRVTEGQYVHQGDALFVLSTEEGSPETPLAQAAAIGTIEERLASLRREITRQRMIGDMQAEGIRARLKDTEAELSVLDSELRTQQERVASAKRTTARFVDLLPQHYVSEFQVQQKRDELLEQQTRLLELERVRASLHRDLDALSREEAAAALASTNQREAAERDAAALEQQLTEYQAHRTILITAPAGGLATAIVAAKGQRTTPQTVLLSIVPAGAHLDAHLVVPSRAIGFIAIGQRSHCDFSPFRTSSSGAGTGM